MRQKGFAPLLIILAGVVIVAAAFFAPKLLNKTPSPTQAPETNAPVTIINFSTTDGKYSFDYPSDWSLNDKSGWVTYEGGFYKDDIEISKGDYIFETYDPSPSTPSECLFNGEESMGPSISVSNYEELTASNGKVLRIGQFEGGSGEIRWVVCQKNGKYFDTVSLIGSTGFTTPKDFDPRIVNKIKDIVISFKKLK